MGRGIRLSGSSYTKAHRTAPPLHWSDTEDASDPRKRAASPSMNSRWTTRARTSSRSRSTSTLGQAVAQIQQQPVGGRIVYFYVVDRDNRLQGVLPIRRVLLNPPETPVADVMVHNVVALPATATLEDACGQFMLHRFLALPIVDDNRQILGVVDVELYTDRDLRPGAAGGK